MAGDLDALGLSPAQERVALAIPEFTRGMASGGGGRVVFLAGRPGSGTSHLLRVLEGRLDGLGLRVSSGRLAEPLSGGRGPEWAGRAEAVVNSAFSVASALDPALSLAASLAGLSAAAAAVLRAATEGSTDSTELVTRALRSAAREEPDRPLICLVDDATWLSASWWTELQFSFAREIVDGLPLLLVLAVEELPCPEAPSDDEAPSSRVARSLLARGLADPVSLEELRAEELGGWLGPMPRQATKGMMELTRGRTGEIAELWRAWTAHGVLESAGMGWRLGDADGILDDALTELSRRLDALRGGRDRSGDDLLREALAYGALEGRRFTATAVARALDHDQDEVEDLLDELVADVPEEGILRPPWAIEVQGPPQHDSRVLWRYEFTNSLLWRAARDRLSDVPAAVAAPRLLDAVLASFGQETPLILPGLARLAALAGDSAEAARYRALVTAPSAAAWAAQADLVLTAEKSDWVAADYRDAAEVLAEAAMELRDHRDNRSLLAFTREATAYAEAAGEIGGWALAFAIATEGHLLLRIGELARAVVRLEAAREIVREGAPGLLALILRQLAEVIRDQNGSFDEQRRLLNESLFHYRRVRNAKGEATVKYNLAGIAGREGDLTRARSLNEEALAGMRADRDRRQEVTVLQQRANIELKDESLGLARELIDEVMAYAVAVGNKSQQSGCLSLLARVELQSGNFEEAWSSSEAALALLRSARKDERPAGEARILHTMGDAAIGLGKTETGRSLLEEAQAILERVGDRVQLQTVEGKLKDLAEPPS